MRDAVLLVLHDEETEPDLEPLVGCAVLRVAVATVADAWTAADAYRGGTPEVGREVVGHEDGGPRRRLAVLGRGRRPSGPGRLVLGPRPGFEQETPRPRFWLASGLAQVQGLLDGPARPVALLAVGPRSQLLAWHVGTARPQLPVATSAAALVALLASPLPDGARARVQVLGRSDVIYQAVPDIPAAPSVSSVGGGGAVVVGAAEADGPGVELVDGTVRVVGADVDEGTLSGRAGAVDVAAPATGTRLLVAPANFAGQAAAWLHALSGVHARNLTVVAPSGGLTFPADVTVTSVEWADVSVRARIAARELVPATHVLGEALRPIAALGTRGKVWHGNPDAAGRELEILRESGRVVGVVVHGSEARNLEQHLERYPFSPFADQAYADEWDSRRRQIASVHEWLQRLQVPVYVTTPDMLDFVPGAQWLPLALNPGSLREGAPVLGSRLPVVLHAPSSGPLKGTVHVDDALGRLHDEGRIEYRRLSAVPSWELPAHIRRADVVVDQVVLGNPGVLALQSLAAGRLTVAHVLPHVRERYERRLPLVEATPDTLRDVVLDLVSDVDAARSLSAEGAAFVRELHDGRASADVLRRFVATQPAR